MALSVFFCIENLTSYMIASVHNISSFNNKKILFGGHVARKNPSCRSNLMRMVFRLRKSMVSLDSIKMLSQGVVSS